MDKRTARFIGLALAESARSTYDRVRIGAVLVHKNFVVSAGANLSTSHPLQYNYNTKVGRLAPRHCLHAEMHAIVRARDYGWFDQCDMFVARLDRRGKLAMCKPCRACHQALEDRGIQRVTYTTPFGIVTEPIKEM